MNSWIFLAVFILLTVRGALGSGASAPARSVDERSILRSRLFEEPLIPLGGDPLPAENEQLAAALAEYSRRPGNDDVSSLTQFLDAYPASSWRVALMTNLGSVYARTGRFTKALDAWQRAWDVGKAHAHPLADRAFGELANLHARLGHASVVTKLLAEVDGLSPPRLDPTRGGSETGKGFPKTTTPRDLRGPGAELASQARQMLWSMQHTPETAFRCGPFALDQLFAFRNRGTPGGRRIMESISTPRGTSLAYLAKLAGELGMKCQAAHARPGAPPPLPCLVHWKAGHYAALLESRHGLYRALDPSFAHEIWLSPKALAEECSGYFLVSAGRLPKGWRAVGEKEAGTVWGGGPTAGSDPDGNSDCDKKQGPGGSGCGMPVYSFHLLLASLSITDTPIGYSPPRGPDIDISLNYSQREINQPAVFSYSNFGPNWTFNWLSYIEDNPVNPSANVDCYLPGGGAVTFSGYAAATSTFTVEPMTQGSLRRSGPAAYELTSSDGSRLLFTKPNDAAAFPRKVFLTQWIDPQGNPVQLNYDDELRITTIVDAIGQNTTFSYDDPNEFFRITKVTDPFARVAGFEYHAAGQLAKITDVIGLASEFTYGAGNFISRMTTPYGITSFTTGVSGRTAFVEATEPDGEKRRVEYNEKTNIGIADNEAASLVPDGLNAYNDYLYTRNSFYWDREAMKRAPGDFTMAQTTHWLHKGSANVAGRIPESEKAPLENRVWYNYPGQSQSYFSGTSSQPSKASRILEDGSVQLSQFAYNNQGNLTEAVDPLGRKTLYVYASNGIDLLEVRQANGAGTDLLTRYSYNAQHLPLKVTDAAGQSTTLTYNPAGQMLTMKNARNDVLTYNYDTNGYLLTVDGPLPGATDVTAFAYDAMGRVRTVTDSEGYALTYTYDAMDRLTKITFPDSTTEEFAYDRLDLVTSKDRIGRTTTYEFDSLRQLVKHTDPLGRTTCYEWCRCGDLRRLIDPLGQATAWTYDIQGRMAGKIFADGSKTLYQYEAATGRLRAVTDAKGQTTHYQYYEDDAPARIFYTGAAVPTPEVRFAYDSIYGRLTSRTDGSGVTLMSYHGLLSPGALQLAAVDGPLPADTITYTYDEPGRIVSRAINGVPFSQSFDAAGRVSATSNALGAFQFNYVNATDRLASVAFPNGQSDTREYYGNEGDQLLRQITHRRADSTILSKFAHTYDASSRIRSWTREFDGGPPVPVTVEYDAAGRLISLVRPDKSFSYGYDSADNRRSETIDAVTVQTQFNCLNEAVNISNGLKPATSYEWDAADRLTAVVIGTHRSEFSYDGHGRRVRIVEKENGSVTSDRRYVWCGTELCEERSAAGDVVLKRFFPQGFETGGTKFYYTRDHLGSIREVTDAGGQIRARYDYDPFGRRIKLAGDLDADFGFTGFYFHAPSSLQLTLYRPYDAESGRWLSRDPIEEAGGVNLYAYAANDPINLIDPLGTSPGDFPNPVCDFPRFIKEIVIPIAEKIPLKGPAEKVRDIIIEHGPKVGEEVARPAVESVRGHEPAMTGGFVTLGQRLKNAAKQRNSAKPPQFMPPPLKKGGKTAGGNDGKKTGGSPGGYPKKNNGKHCKSSGSKKPGPGSPMTPIHGKLPEPGPWNVDVYLGADKHTVSFSR